MKEEESHYLKGEKRVFVHVKHLLTSSPAVSQKISL